MKTIIKTHFYDLLMVRNKLYHTHLAEYRKNPDPRSLLSDLDSSFRSSSMSLVPLSSDRKARLIKPDNRPNWVPPGIIRDWEEEGYPVSIGVEVGTVAPCNAISTLRTYAL
jgi:hypothetical protein